LIVRSDLSDYLLFYLFFRVLAFLNKPLPVETFADKRLDLGMGGAHSFSYFAKTASADGVTFQVKDVIVKACERF